MHFQALIVVQYSERSIHCEPDKAKGKKSAKQFEAKYVIKNIFSKSKRIFFEAFAEANYFVEIFYDL
ncbi:hypothetical protein PPUJ20028_46520 [Pseudomonas putida]|uniref:Uncharacterized protein n=1 Tax=Pseudomonas putida TaxID=303 RepID=A0AA37RC92_PSEPU|nr:hypothetical protein PPUJ20028_46520 [Pseudomonas putida]GLO37875.1 hypothetical protein PPUN14671_47120 [Pseudomonas putida]